MVSEWPQQRLGDIVTNFDARRVPLSARERECRKGKYPYYGATGIMDYIDDYLFEGLHLLVAEDGSVETESGTPFLQLVDGRFWVNNHAHVLKGETDTDTRYLFYALSSIRIRPFVTGSVQPKLSQTNLNNVPIPYPSVHQRTAIQRTAIQRTAIAHILGTLDDKIELNRQMNQTLEAMAQALFKSWFVDFEPFRDQGMQDSPLGEIPLGWRVVSIEDIAERVGMGPFGSSIKVSTFVPDGIPIISGQHLNQTLLEDNHYNFITPSHAEKLKNSNVFRGDIIFTHAGNIGQVAYIPETSQYERYVISQRQFYMRCDLSKISPLFVIYFFKTPQGQHSLLANTSSTGVPSISQPVSYLKTIKLPVPTKTLIDAFDKIVRKLHQQIANNISQAKTLSAIRDALLPRLLSGEIRVKDAEKFVESKL